MKNLPVNSGFIPEKSKVGYMHKEESPSCHYATKTMARVLPFVWFKNPTFESKIDPTMLRSVLLLLLLAAFAFEGRAQIAQNGQVGIVYNRETTFNFRLNTQRSFGFGVEWGRLRTYNKTKTLSLYIGELKHPKEQKQNAAPSLKRSLRPFVYGKQNSLFVLRGSWGQKRYFSEKAKQKGVAIGMSYSFGPSLGLLKPYYLALNFSENGSPSGRPLFQKYTEQNDSVFLDNSKILGAGPFTKGFGEISILPGGNASIAYHMDWGAYDEMVKALEIGLSIDVFARKAPIFVDGTEANQQVFFNFFLNLQFGKRK
ncbi:MAG: hypothetical protein SFV22_04680 [Saprospiraceae bacterium]|nr:hypothetical protein [Saprospiraceae bacterium]